MNINLVLTRCGAWHGGRHQSSNEFGTSLGYIVIACLKLEMSCPAQVRPRVTHTHTHGFLLRWEPPRVLRTEGTRLRCSEPGVAGILGVHRCCLLCENLRYELQLSCIAKDYCGR